MSQGSRVGNVELIALRGAAKRYRVGGPWVLADVDLAVAPGTVAMASGANGSGKSTLLRILAGVALGALFSRPLVRSRAVAVFGLTGAAVFTVPAGISPAIATAKALDVTHPGTAAANLLPTLAAISLFLIAAGLACVSLWRRSG